MYNFLVFNEYGEFAISSAEPFTKRGSLNGKPTVRARLSSEYLHQAPEGSVEELIAWLRLAVPDAEKAPQASEAHYHADVVGWEPSMLGYWVSPVAEETRRTYYCSCGCNRQRLSSTRFGEKDAAELQVLVYDKTREMAKPDNADPTLRAIWRQNGWDGVPSVYRVESRFQRDFLRDRASRATATFTRLGAGFGLRALNGRGEVVPSTADSNRHRWPMSPAWEFIRTQVFPQAEPAPKVVQDKSADALRLFKQADGTFAAAAAKLRLGGTNLGEALDLMSQDGEIGWKVRDRLRSCAERSAQKSREQGVAPLIDRKSA